MHNLFQNFPYMYNHDIDFLEYIIFQVIRKSLIQKFTLSGARNLISDNFMPMVREEKGNIIQN